MLLKFIKRKEDKIVINKLEQDLNIKLTDREKMILNYYDKLLKDKENDSNRIITKVIKKDYPQLKSYENTQIAIDFAKSQNVQVDCRIVDTEHFIFCPTIYKYLIKLTGKQKDIELVEKYF